MDTDQIETEVVQPDEGQGDGGGGSEAPYAEYLNQVPEEYRGQIEPVFRDWDANVTRRFQDASEFRKGWEPYEQSGVRNYAPEDVQFSLQLRQMLDNPAEFKRWVEDTYAPHYGIQFGQQPAQPQPGQRQAADTQTFDEFSQYEDPQVRQLTEQLQQMQQQLGQVSQWREQTEHQAREEYIAGLINGEITALEKQHPGQVSRDDLDTFIAKYERSLPEQGDPAMIVKNVVSQAWGDLQAFRTNIERQFAQAKVDVPTPPESGGVADTSAPEIRSLQDAGRIAREQLKEMNRLNRL